MASKRKLEVVITGDSTGFSRSLGRSAKDADTWGKKVERTFKRVGKAAAVGGLAVAAAGVTGFVAIMRTGWQELSEGQKVVAQTNAVIKSTGGVANVSAKAVSDYATALMLKTGIDDEAIASSQNLLLSFTNIRNEAGKGNDIFNQATKATLDLSVAFKKDLPSASIMVGKALNDPIAGITALSKAGVQFTKQQKEQVKALVESGDTLGAQKLILKELNREVGGSSEAFGKTLPGQLRIAREAWNNVTGAITAKFLPVLTAVATYLLTKAVPALEDFSDWIGKKIPWGKVKSGAQGVLDTLKDIKTAFTDAKDAGAGLGGAIGAAIGTGLESINWDVVGQGMTTALAGTGALATGISNGIKQAISSINGADLLSGLVKILAEAINALFSPSWWAENFMNVLTVVTVVLPLAKIFKIPGATALYNWLSKPIFEGLQRLGSGLLGRLGGLGSKIAAGLINGIVRAAAKLPGNLGLIIELAAKKIAGKIGLFGKYGKQIGLALVVAVGTGLRGLAGIAVHAVSAFVGSLVGMLSTLLATGKQLGAKVVSGVSSGLSGIASVGQTVLSGLLNAVAGVAASVYGTATSVGKAVVNGIKNGIGSLMGELKSWLESKIRDLLDKLNPFSPVEHGGEIHIGRPIITGGITGITKEAPKLSAALNKVIRDAVGEAKGNLGSLTDSLVGMVGEGIDARMESRISALGNSPLGQKLKAIRSQQNAESVAAERARIQADIDAPTAPTDELKALSDFDLDTAKNKPKTRDEVLENQEKRAELVQAVNDAQIANEKRKNDAIEEMRQFNLDQEAAALEEELAKQEAQITEEETLRKDSVEKQVALLTDQFKRGKVLYKDFVKELKGIFKSQEGDFSSIGEFLGTTSSLAFMDVWKGVIAQAGKIAQGPIMDTTGNESQISDPFATELAGWREERKKLSDPLKAVRDEIKDIEKGGVTADEKADLARLKGRAATLRGKLNAWDAKHPQPKRRKLARGALITRPTEALIGEAGDELVLPMERPRRAAELLNKVGIGGGVTVNQYFAPNAASDDPAALMAAASWKLRTAI